MYIAAKFYSMRKTLSLAMLFLLPVFNLSAQLIRATPPVFSENLAKITQAFRNNYYSIQGEQLPSQDDMDTYRSNVSMPGAKQALIYRFHSKVDTTASWQCLLYAGDNFREALKAYKNACRDVNRTKVILGDNAAATYKGKIEEPEEGLRFVSSIFILNTKDPPYEKFYAEVEIVNLNFDQWEVHLNLQSKKDDTEK